MRRLFLLSLVAAFTACGSTPAAAPPTEDAARIECDRFAARAIQAAAQEDAARLAASAAECYAGLGPAVP